MPARPITHPLALERLADARTTGGDVDPLGAAIALATHFTPMLKPERIRGALDAFARDVAHLLAHENPVVSAVNHVLYDRYGFHGNRDHYNDPLNSYVDRVLERRTGLPILLALVWVEAARRAGVTAHGIGLPGHFVVAVDLPESPGTRVYVDAFTRGVVMTLEDCQKVAIAAGIAWHEEFLQPVSGLQWAIRMLNNLRNSYVEMNDPASTAAVLEQMLLLDPRNAVRQQELQALYAQLDRHAAGNN